MAATGELELFWEIWDERPHKCAICGQPLPVFNVRFFSHCVTKGSHPELRLLEQNIDILCYPDHVLWENEKHKIRGDEKWQWMFDKYVKLKQLRWKN